MVRQYDQYLKTKMTGIYPQLDAAKNDALNALMHFKDLRPQAEQFIYNDGSRKSLINLSGTIPVMYKGTTYNIPVAIWLQEPHPQTAPLCFVKPTNTMQVKQGKHVDANGRVYLPYLNEWRMGTHNLIGCIQVMTAVFSESPPVFSKQAAPVRPSPTPPYPSTSQPPYPPASGFSVQGPPTANYQANFNPPAPYPGANQHTPYPMTTQSPMTTQPSPYPPYSGFSPTAQMNVPPATNPPYPQTAGLQQKSQQPVVDDNMIRASLISAANDKLKRRLKESLSQADAEMQRLKQTESELRAGKDKLDTILKRLENEINEADTSMVMLQTKNEELDKEIDRLKRQDNFDADEAVMATTPVYRQIVTSFAEEQALEDTIYYLGEALHKDLVDLDTFLKHVRALSRQQFTLRALIQKARKSAGLANVY